MSIDEVLISPKIEIEKRKEIPLYSERDEIEYNKEKNKFDKPEYDTYRCAKKYIFYNQNMFDEETFNLFAKNYYQLSKNKDEINKLYKIICEVLSDVKTIHGFNLSDLKNFTKVAHNLIESGRYFSFENQLTLIKYHNEMIEKCNNLITIKNSKLYSECAENRTKKDIVHLRKHIELHKVGLLSEVLNLGQKHPEMTEEVKNKLEENTEKSFSKLFLGTLYGCLGPHNAYFLDYICERTIMFHNKKDFLKYSNIIENSVKNYLKSSKDNYCKSVANNALGTLYKVKLLKDINRNFLNEGINIQNIFSRKEPLEKILSNKNYEFGLKNKYEIRLYTKVLWDISTILCTRLHNSQDREEIYNNYKKQLKNAKKYIKKYSSFIQDNDFTTKRKECEEQVNYLMHKFNICDSLQGCVHDAKGKDMRKENIKKIGKRWNHQKKINKTCKN
jgi:hypothetical protein